MDETKEEASYSKADKVSWYTYCYYLNIKGYHSSFLSKRDMMQWCNNQAVQQEVALLAKCNVQDAVFIQQKKTQSPNDLFILPEYFSN